MTPFTAGSFLLALAAATCLVRVLPQNAVSARAVVLAASGFAVLRLALGIELWKLAVLAAALVWLLLAAPMVAGWRRKALAIAVAWGPLAVIWAASKQVAVETSAPVRAISFLGISYLLVKGYTLVKDILDRRVPAPGLAAGLAYFLFFPTYLAGPMHYYSEFSRDLESPAPLSGTDVIDVLFRFLVGLLKVTVVAPLLAPASLLALTGIADPPASAIISGAFVFSAVLLLDFSGYTDMAIATARVAGISTPENFRLPYLARNPREFWQRWHITFSRVLTSYIFVPVTRALQGRYGLRRESIAAVGCLVTFVIAGYWHGPTANFVVWGIYHAAGLFVYDMYNLARRNRVAGGVARRSRYIGTAVALAGTFAFVSMGWIFFVLPADVTVGRLGSWSGIVSVAGAFAIYGLLVTVALALLPRAATVRLPLAPAPR